MIPDPVRSQSEALLRRTKQRLELLMHCAVSRGRCGVCQAAVKAILFDVQQFAAKVERLQRSQR